MTDKPLLGGLIVSCQARADNPMHGANHMAAMARAAVEGGASAIRANGSDDVAAICRAVDVPVIGINKIFSDHPVYITPTCAAAREVAAAGASIIALDATYRDRPEEPLEEVVAFIRDELGCRVFADVSTLNEGLTAQQLGADYVATTLSGYTEETQSARNGPDLGLVRDLVWYGTGPVIAEGRFETPDQVAKALDLGAAAVVVGTAITNPREITRRFATATKGVGA